MPQSNDHHSEVKHSAPIYLGTMSGTSLDGLDLVATTFDSLNQPTLLASQFTPYPDDLKSALLNLTQSANIRIDDLGHTDTRLAHFYADCINGFCKAHALDKSLIEAIGSHGQTIWHCPTGDAPFTLQIGDPNIIAARTEIDVVADFRRRDMAVGGQGAPFACAYHNQVFRSKEFNRAVINIGGIANITCLPKDPEQPVIGYDTGPGNALIDSVCRTHFEKPFDEAGQLARSGKIQWDALNSILDSEPYFHAKYPKSTGTEYFSENWLQQTGLMDNASPEDWLATLVELTVQTINLGIDQSGTSFDELYVCGGGTHNNYMLERLQLAAPSARVMSTQQLGLHPDWVEATTFAWLAQETLNFRPANLPSVTKAKNLTILGGVYFHRQRQTM